MKDTVTSRFDEIIARHLERLTGSRRGIEGLPLNIATIGCLILLGGRELEIQNSGSHPNERYTLQTFLDEAAILGAESDQYLEEGLRDMIERGYCELDSEGRITAKESTMAMTHILDHIFPKMQGVNLLAYIGQTLEEAITTRTDLESATSRLDQTMKHHGVPLEAWRHHEVCLPQPFDDRHSSEEGLSENRLSREEILAELYNRAKTTEADHLTKNRSNRIIAGGTILRSVTIEDILLRDGATAGEIQSAAGPGKREDSLDITDVVPDTPVIPADPRHGSEDTPLGSELSEPTKTCHPCQNYEKDRFARESKNDVEDAHEISSDDKSAADDAVAERIAAFEKDLSLACPICKTSMLREQSTEAGKKYYTCASDNCNFISWGRPHHVECRRCKNPFLIEIRDTSGDMILKCPRATCQHHQSLSPKLVKVIRRRVVRRVR